jgi:integrase
MVAGNYCLFLHSHSPWPLPLPIQMNLIIGGFEGVTTLQQVIQDLIIAKQNSNKRDYYVKSLKSYLRRFAETRESQSIAQIRVSDIEIWLQQFKDPSSRQTWLNRISTLFSFAVKRKYIEKNPCEQVERITVVRKPPVILNVYQSRQLLDWCSTAMRPYYVLATFAGIRPFEAERLDWSDVNLEAKTVRINGKVAKIQSHRRIVPLEPIAIKLLSRHPVKTGPISPLTGTVKRWKVGARAILGYKEWPCDILRHSTASYWMATRKDADGIAADLGNSRKILMAHYHEPVTPDAAAVFWNPDILSIAELPEQYKKNL